MQRQANTVPNYAPASTMMTQVPFINTLKRKRGQNGSASPSVEQPFSKQSAQTVSQVQQPALNTTGTETFESGRSNPVPMSHTNQAIENRSKAGAFSTFSAGFSNTSTKPTLAKLVDPLHDSPATHGKQQRHKGMTGMASLRGVIESQFNLEILLKHRELRLIEQELAKCQIAFEQLRRCQIIPYPAQLDNNLSLTAVASGSGQIYNNYAPHAPPWGVAEGAYTRHYGRWLLPSAAFDDTNVDDPQTPSVSDNRLSDRPTRTSMMDQGSLATQSRSQRGTSTRLKALPHGYPEPKEEKGPMIVKRSSDGHMVKLVCLDCRRSNFNSVQGFINHCRIAHTRQFASHDAAIEASGEKVDAEVAGGTEVNGPQGAASAGLVHPMIRSARPPIIDSTMPSSLKHKKGKTASPQPSPNSVERQAFTITPHHHSVFTDTETIPFKPSPQTPHLSALFSKMSRGGDLDEIVTEAKKREDLDLFVESDDEDFTDEVDEAAPLSRSTRGVIQSSVRPASSSNSVPTTSNIPSYSERKIRSHSANNFFAGVQTPILPSPYSADIGRDDQDSSVAPLSTPYNLSPNTTDPHPAPSLVSDDGDYDNTHSESEASTHTEMESDDDHYIHPGLLDQVDLELGESSGINLEHPGKSHGPTTNGRSRPLTTIHTSPHHQGRRHVSFASPARKPRRAPKPSTE